MNISLPMTDNNLNRSAAATNVPATCIAAVAIPNSKEVIVPNFTIERHGAGSLYK